MSIAETLRTARAALHHPILNPGDANEFICHAISWNSTESDAEDAINFLEDYFGMDTSGAHFCLRVNGTNKMQVDGVTTFKEAYFASQSARLVLLDAAIHLACKLGK